MNANARLAKLERTAKGVERHTCGPIVFVDFDEELPPPLPDCEACELEFRRTGRRKITVIEFGRTPPREE